MTEARKFTDDQVRQITREYRAPCPHCGKPSTLRELGEKWGVAHNTIRSIVNRTHAYFWVEY